MLFLTSTLRGNLPFSFFPTCVFGEADAECRLLDLLCEQILLVEEEDDGSVDEELVVADRVEQHQRLVHAILRRRKRDERGEKEMDGERWENKSDDEEEKRWMGLEEIKGTGERKRRGLEGGRMRWAERRKWKGRGRKGRKSEWAMMKREEERRGKVKLPPIYDLCTGTRLRKRFQC